MLINLLSILSQDGKEQELQIPLEMDTFQSQRAAYRIAEKDDMKVHLIHKGNKVVELDGVLKLGQSVMGLFPMN